MPAVKDYFDPKKRAKLLEDAIRKTKGKGEFTFAFGIGKSGGLMAIDFKNEHTPDKFLKQIKTTDFKDKFVVGTASIKGKIIDMKSAHNKNKIKPKEVKDFLAQLKSTVSRTIIDGERDDEDQTPNGTAPEATAPAQTADGKEAELDQARTSLNKAMKSINALLDKL